MKQFTALKLSFTALALAWSLSGFSQKETKVLFIGVDGVRSDALLQANTPEINALAAAGVITYTSWHLGTTVSGPSWSAMLTGVWEDKHGIVDNSYVHATQGGNEVNPNWTDFPYFPTRVREHRPNIVAYQITSWLPMSFNVQNDGWGDSTGTNVSNNYKIWVPNDDDCRDAAISILTTVEDLDVLFVHLDDVDAQGHSNGFTPGNPDYVNMIQYKDQQVGAIIDALEARPNYANEDWLVLMTTDHGGIGTGHGGATTQERLIWWLARGANLPAGYEISVEAGAEFNDSLANEAPLLVDIAVTAIDHLLPTVDPEAEPTWDLDGKSWIKRLAGVTGRLDPIREQLGNVRISPNPNSGRFTLGIPADFTGTLNYQVLDVTGRAVASGSSAQGQTRVDVDLNVPAGTYLVKLEQDGRVKSGRIVVR